MIINDKSIQYTAKMYLAAEIHGVKNNSQIKYDLLCSLNQYAGVTFFLVEMGCYEAEGLNYFLMTGDINILKRTIKNREPCYANTNEELGFWIKLCKFNLLLPQDKKIKVIGIDCNGRFRDLVFYAKYINKSIKIKSSLKKSIEGELFKLETGLKQGECTDTLIFIVKDIIKKIEYLDPIIIEKLKMILEEIYIKLYRLSNPVLAKMKREEYMVRRLSNELQKNPHANFFGQLGYAHVYKINEHTIPVADHIIKRLTDPELLTKIMFIYKDTVYQKKEKNTWMQYELDMFDIENTVTKQLLKNSDFPLILLENKENVNRYTLYENNTGFYIII